MALIYHFFPLISIVTHFSRRVKQVFHVNIPRSVAEGMAEKSADNYGRKSPAAPPGVLDIEVLGKLAFPARRIRKLEYDGYFRDTRIRRTDIP